MAAATGAVIGGLGAAAGAVSGFMGAKENADAADSQLALQGQIHEDRMELGREQLEWAKGIYNEWRQEFDPVLQQLKTEAMAGRTPDFGAIAADTRMAFQSARDSDRREQGRYGIKPGDGQFGASERRYNVAEAAGEINARQDARRDYENDEFARLSNVYGFGTQLQSGAMGHVAQGFGSMQGAMGSAANTAGNNARMHAGMSSRNMAGGMSSFDRMLDSAMQIGGDSAAGPDLNDVGWDPVNRTSSPWGQGG